MKRSYHYLDQRPTSGTVAATLLCLHGFPDLSYGWRHQIQPWVAHGYRVVVPDMLGYGGTEMPMEASAYTTKRLCDDLAALLDHLGVQRAVVVGHDWGSFIAGRFALWYPGRLLALAMLSIPYTPPSMHYTPLHELVRRFPPFGYQTYFASEQSTTEIEAHLRSFLRVLFQARVSWPPFGESQQFPLDGREPDGCLLSDEELEYYVSIFQRGMTGPLSYYRTTRLRFEEEKDAALPSSLPAGLPVIFIHGTDDATCSPVAVRNMKKFTDLLQVVPIPGVGHWVMLEAPQTVTERILQWLRSALGSGAPARL